MANVFGQGTFDRWRNNPANAADVQDLIYDEWETCKCSFVGGGAAGATCSAVALQISVNLPYTLFGTAGGPDRLVGVSSASLVHTQCWHLEIVGTKMSNVGCSKTCWCTLPLSKLVDGNLLDCLQLL
jgi:hypothetical protein